MLDAIELSESEVQLRAELTDWICHHRPPELVGASADDVRLHGSADQRAVFAEWTDDAARDGWVCAGWPVEYGGRGLGERELAMVTLTFAAAGLPRPNRSAGESLVGPAVINHGTDEQKRRFLRPIVSGEHVYCQGFSEPDAGSDLAGLRTRGDVDGEEVVITGQKIWTSGADRATHIFVLCRTNDDVPRHRGISYVLVPMRHPSGEPNGIEIRPIRQMTGQARFFETFFDGARAPVDNVIGGLDEGWRSAMTTLSNERAGKAASQYLDLRRQFDAAVARLAPLGPVGRDRFARLFAEMEILRINALRTLHDPRAAERLPVLHKALWSEHLQRVADAVIDLLGPMGQAPARDEAAERALDHFLQSRCHTIWGGTAEIQRNIIAERLLGLPKEPPAAKGDRS